MPKSKKFSIFECNKIVELYKDEHNPIDISKILNISRMIINNIISK